MYLTLEKFDSYDDGVSFNAKVFQTLEQAKAYAQETYDSYLADLVEAWKEERYGGQIAEPDYEAFTPEFNEDAIEAPMMYSINATDNYYFCIQIQKIPETLGEAIAFKHEPRNGELIELSDSNGI